MANIVLGSTATITVQTVDNSQMYNVPNGTPQPVAVDQILINLYTPSGQQPVVGATMTAGSQTGYYTFAYQSSIYDEVGEWFADFQATAGSFTAFTPRQGIFRMISA